MKKFLALAFLCLSACSHLVVDSTERLQIKNLSDKAITRFSVVGKSDTLLWVPDTVLPGELSFVREADFVGTFYAVFYAADSTGKFHLVDAGKIHFDGGSELLKFSEKDDVWDLEFE